MLCTLVFQPVLCALCGLTAVFRMKDQSCPHNLWDSSQETEIMKKVLIVIDGSGGSKALLSFFYNMVRPPESLLLVYIQRPGMKSVMSDIPGDAGLSTIKTPLNGLSHDEVLPTRAANILGYFREELKNCGLIDVKTVIRHGIPSEEILKVAREEGVDTIIAGMFEADQMMSLIFRA